MIREEAMIDARIKTILQRASSLLLLLFLLCSCENTLFHSFSSVGGEWQRSSVVEFAYGNRYNSYSVCGLQIEARTDASYRYKNIVVRAEYFNKSDSLLHCDTIPVLVYNDEGHRIGATVGVLYQQESNVILPKISFNDTVHIRLNHIMPDESLKGVHDIGIKLIDIN